MLYPHTESFDYSFEEGDAKALWSQEVWNKDLVIGLKRPLEDQELSQFIDDVAKAVFKHAEDLDLESASPLSVINQ
jgi:hypothetical protein